MTKHDTNEVLQNADTQSKHILSCTSVK